MTKRIQFWDSFNKIWLNENLFCVNCNGEVERKGSEGKLPGVIAVYHADLSDIKSNPVYEGFIVEYDREIPNARSYKGHNERTIPFTGIIVFEEGAFKIKNFKEDASKRNFYTYTAFHQISGKVFVLGNKYENPELLRL